MGMGLNIEVIETPTYLCPFCEATFASQIELDAHIASEHPSPPIAGIWDLLKKYGPWIGVSGLVGLTIFAILKKK